MNELDREAVRELQVLVDIYVERNELDAAAKVLFVVEALERRINKNVVQMSGWESSSPPSVHQQRELTSS
jgi:hypothetical protein